MESPETGGWELEGPPMIVGDEIRLIPHMADSYFGLLEALVASSERNPGVVATPATAAIVAVATLESYLNELINITTFDGAEEGNDRIKAGLRKHGTDVPAKLAAVRSLSNRPAKVENDTMDQVRTLVGVRGLLAHYDPQAEHPTATRTSLQRLAPRLGVSLPAERVAHVSLDALLTPRLARWALDLTAQVIRQLYEAGYEPPRPRWLRLVDPARP
jgi:hypothetical protein